MRKNISISYILAYLYHSWFWLGIWIFYYLRFTDYKGIGIIESVMIILTILFDIPTGVITDKIGKKKSLIIAFLFTGLGNILFGFSTSFTTLLFSISFFCFGSAFYSGTFEAMQFDSLKSIGKDLEFKLVASKTNTYTLIAFALSSVIGGFLYKILPGLPFILVGMMHFVAMILAFFLVEPEIDSEKSSGFQTFFADQIQGFKELTKNIEIKKISLFLSVVGVVTVICSQTLNDLLGYEFGFTPVYFGFVTAVIYLLASFVSRNTSKLTEHLGEWRTISLASTLIAFTLLASPFLGVLSGTIILAIRNIFQNIFDVVGSVVINHRIESKFRATTLSTFNFVKNLPYAFAAVALGSAMGGIGAKMFAFYLGLLLIIFLVGYWIIVNQKISRE